MSDFRAGEQAAADPANRFANGDVANRACGARQWRWAAWEQPQRQHLSHDLGLLQPCRERRDGRGGDQGHPGQAGARRRAAPDWSDCADCASHIPRGKNGFAVRRRKSMRFVRNQPAGTAA